MNATRRSEGRRYWPFYCEENVWFRCHDPAAENGHALLITNAGRQVLLGHQWAGEGSGALVVWDYHAVYLYRQGHAWRVHDPDSNLADAVSLDIYLEATFPHLPPRYAALAPGFRLLTAASYLENLRSDRSHMRTASGGWRMPPPPWPCIGTGSTLMALLDLSRPSPGLVLDLPMLRQHTGAL